MKSIYDRTATLIEEAVQICKDVQKTDRAKSYRATAPVEAYIKQYCTVTIELPRQVGKTCTALRLCAKHGGWYLSPLQPSHIVGMCTPDILSKITIYNPNSKAFGYFTRGKIEGLPELVVLDRSGHTEAYPLVDTSIQACMEYTPQNLFVFLNIM